MVARPRNHFCRTKVDLALSQRLSEVDYDGDRPLQVQRDAVRLVEDRDPLDEAPDRFQRWCSDLRVLQCLGEYRHLASVSLGEAGMKGGAALVPTSRSKALRSSRAAENPFVCLAPRRLLSVNAAARPPPGIVP